LISIPYDFHASRSGMIIDWNCLGIEELRLTNGLNSIITQLERQKSAIERALAALRDVDGAGTPAPAPVVPATRRSVGKNRRSEGQKKRWASQKSEVSTPSVSAESPASRKGGMTEDGRRRLAEAMKRRWAVKRSGSSIKKRAGRTRKAA
jgi:hypothetical protein